MYRRNTIGLLALVLAAGLVLGGTAAAVEEDEEVAPAPRDITHNDDVIVEGSLCAGDSNDCADGEVFTGYGLGNFELEVKLEDNNPSLGFQDTSPGAAHWVIAMGSNDRLAFQNAAAEPVAFEAGALNDSLVVDSTSRVGFGTGSPQAPIDLRTTDAGTGNSVLLLRRSGGPVAFQLKDDDTGDFWNITMTDGAGEFRFSRSGTGQREMTLDQAGNMTITGTLTQGSDATAKVGLRPVDTRAVLDAVTGLPLSTWQYAADPGVTHLGPTAQDFAAAFDLGATSTGIAAVDADGVALAAIQALAEQNAALQARVAALEARLATSAARGGLGAGANGR